MRCAKIQHRGPKKFGTYELRLLFTFGLRHQKRLNSDGPKTDLFKFSANQKNEAKKVKG